MKEDEHIPGPRPQSGLSNRLVVVSGYSGAGKSTLMDELAWRGHATFPEPGGVRYAFRIDIPA